ncbi:hypothetical protein [Aquibium microcysteis]|uniref:hypothetical protein n=1 Tax=Aquibium microcysteis TaxID=675281 RepID=UPI00165D01B6|nr:hypothetical protein [Aquibium microcysteis]
MSGGRYDPPEAVQPPETDPDWPRRYEAAKRELAAFKFELFQTVAADPALRIDEDSRLRSSPCVQMIIVYSHFVTIDPKTLEPTAAYASAITLEARGGVKETSGKKARALLVKHGYLVFSGTKTKEGSLKFFLRNPRKAVVEDHVREATEYLQEKQAVERAEERRRSKRHAVGPSNDTTETVCGVAGRGDVGALNVPNYLGVYLGVSSTEGNDTPAVGYGQIPEPEPDEPIDPPETEAELESALNEFRELGLSEAVVAYFAIKLKAGQLTRAMVREQMEMRLAA